MYSIWHHWPLVGILATAVARPWHTELLPTSDNDTLLWGSYRPSVYVEVKRRLPEGVYAGLIWSNVDDASKIGQTLRHTCEQNDGIDYGWEFHDPRTGGRQRIHDSKNMLELTTTIDKQADHVYADGDAWRLYASVMPLSPTPAEQKTMLVFYVGDNSADSTLECHKALDRRLSGDESESVVCTGGPGGQANYSMVFRTMDKDTAFENRAISIRLTSLQVEQDKLWQTKPILMEQLSATNGHSPLLPDIAGQGNLHFIQLAFAGSGDFEISYNMGQEHEMASASVYSQRHTQLRSPFDSALDQAYGLQPPYNSPLYFNLSRSLLSNLLGGIGFFHGTSMVSSDKSYEKGSITGEDMAVEERGPYSLLTSVPSRPFFPRGFLWDEGFHLMVILDWDLDLAVEILMSWLDLMDEHGWIAREQILGADARSRVPAEFQTQYQSYANPPTFFFVMDMLLDRLTGRVDYRGKPSKYMHSPDSRRSQQSRAEMLLKEIYDKLELHYEWWRRTQAGDLTRYRGSIEGLGTFNNEGYRWRGVTPDHILTSGLDDYPRNRNPCKDDLHVDALCWVDLMAQVLKKAATHLFGSSDQSLEAYETVSSQARSAAEELHWSDKSAAYCDTTITSTDALEHVCHKGYVSLMPFITNTVSPQHLEAILDLISDPAHLWSDHGLRSLSTRDEFYGKGENYWRSPVWVNMNYLVLVRLDELAQNNKSPHQARARTLYSQLRLNIVDTVAKSWKETGMAWEQYDPSTGKGQRTEHFTGWTSLIVRIMAMPHLDSVGSGSHKPDQPGLATPGASSASLLQPLWLVVMAAMVLATSLYRRRLMSLFGRFMRPR